MLLLLYVLQGIPLGLAGSIPMILQNRHVSYADQVKAKYHTANIFSILCPLSSLFRSLFSFLCSILELLDKIK